jgi:TonB family protein
MNWLQYLLEANLYLTAFYMVYCLFLNKETYYTLNRVYLIGCCLVAFALPLMQIGSLKPAEQPEITTAVYVMPAADAVMQPDIVAAPIAAPRFTLQDGLVYAYFAGVAILLLFLAFRVYQLIRLTKINSNSTGKGYRLVYLKDSNTAFSFFNFLFIGTNIRESETVIRHELVHIRQKHSADIIFIELLKIINWFNPFIYLLQRSLKAVHEYIADEQTTGPANDALAYSSFLVSNAYGLSGPAITHSFFNYNLLKKRIIMLHQKRSGSLARLKYLLAVPLCGGLLCASTLAFSKNYGWIDLLPKKADAPVAPDVVKHKTLKMTRDGAVGYGDSMTLGNVTYTPDNLTESAKAYLLNKFNTRIEVVEVDGNPGQASLTLPSAQAADKPNAPTATVTGYTKKGYKYKENTFIVNNTINFVVTIYLKDGEKLHFVKSSIYPGDIKLLDEKFGYTFPGNGKYELAKPKQPFVKFPPPVIKPAAPAVAAQNQMKPPPPPPFENVYKDLFEYIYKNVRYPVNLKKVGPSGMAVFEFSVNSDGKVKVVNVANTDNSPFYTEALAVLSSYSGTVKQKPGIYKIAFRFSAGSHVNPDQVRANDKLLYDSVPNLAGIIAVVGYLQAPPPPPAAPKAVKRFPPQVVKPDTSANLFHSLYNQFTKAVIYPKEARAQQIQGRVFVTFEITSDKKIQHIAVLRAPDNSLLDAVTNALQTCSAPDKAEPGWYTMPVYFNLFKPDGSKVESSNKPVQNSSKPIMKIDPAATAAHHSRGLDEVVVSAYTQAPPPPPAPPADKPETPHSGQSAYQKIGGTSNDAQTTQQPLPNLIFVGKPKDPELAYGIAYLHYHLTGNINYSLHTSKNETLGHVLTAFTVNKDKHIINMNVVKSVDDEYSNMTLSALKSYPANYPLPEPGNYMLFTQFKRLNGQMMAYVEVTKGS